MRIGEFGRDLPPDLGAQHVRQCQRQPREAAVEPAQQFGSWSRSGSGPDGYGAQTRRLAPEDLLTDNDRDPAASEDQLGDRLQINRTGLDPAAMDSALLGDMGRFQLQNLPRGRPRRR